MRARRPESHAHPYLLRPLCGDECHYSVKPDHGHQQDVEHHVEADGGLRTDVAQPQRHEHAGGRGDESRDRVDGHAVGEGAIADGLGAELVLADCLQHLLS